MRVVNYLPYDDIGAVGWRTASAFNRHRPDWTYHAYRGEPSYLNFPEHTTWDPFAAVRDWNQADVVHVHEQLIRIGDRKPTVITYHGTGFRENPDRSLLFSGDARVLVSTLDLWLQKPNDTTWMPQGDDLDWLATFRAPRLKGKLRIGHAPTNRALKSTEEFVAACVGLPVEVVMIEGREWMDALHYKGTCDIFFDQTAYGYGGNAIEAWAMGIPVICGAPDNVLEEYRRRFGYLPFEVTDRSSIRDAIIALLDADRRQELGQLGRKHAERFHSFEALVERIAPIYEEMAHG
jgi:hypothetical protein